MKRALSVLRQTTGEKSSKLLSDFPYGEKCILAYPIVRFELGRISKALHREKEILKNDIEEMLAFGYNGAISTRMREEISDITFLSSQKESKESYDGKGIRMDVYLKKGDTIYDIEMQTVTIKELAKRMRYYQGMIDMESISAGQSYKKLKKTYIIFICTFDFYGAGRHIYTFRNLCREDPLIEMGDDASKIVISTKGTMDDVTSEMKQFLEYP